MDAGKMPYPDSELTTRRTVHSPALERLGRPGRASRCCQELAPANCVGHRRLFCHLGAGTAGHPSSRCLVYDSVPSGSSPVWSSADPTRFQVDANAPSNTPGLSNPHRKPGASRQVWHPSGSRKHAACGLYLSRRGSTLASRRRPILVPRPRQAVGCRDREPGINRTDVEDFGARSRITMVVTETLRPPAPGRRSRSHARGEGPVRLV